MLAAPLTPVLFTTRAEATWLVLLPLNRFLASTPFSRNVLLVSRWPLAQIGWLPKPALAPVPLGSSAFTPGDKNRQARETAGGQRHGFDLGFIQHVAVGGVHGVDQRRFLHRDRGAHGPIFSAAVHRDRAVCLHRDRRNFLRFEGFVFERQRIVSDRAGSRSVHAARVAVFVVRVIAGLIAHRGDVRVRHGGAR